MKPLWRVLGVAALGFAWARGPAAEVVVLNDDGAWNWLQDERALIVGDQLVVGSVALGHRESTRGGDIDVTSFDRRTGRIVRTTLHHEATEPLRRRWQDDHSAPALIVRPDGRILAMYATHGMDPTFHFRISRSPGDATEWSEEKTFALPAGSRVAFPHLTLLAKENGASGRLLAFFRGLNNQLRPALAHSDSGGETWAVDGAFLQLPGKATPYVKYAGDGRATVHLAFTDGHRVDFNNAVYHAIYRDGQFWRSNGERIGPLRDGLPTARSATEIFRANPDSVAMISDLALDAAGRPHIVYSVQLNTRPLRPRPVGADHRYRYARWDGAAWHDSEIAFAGTETHDAPDDDCTGLAAIDPQDVTIVYISTNVDPVSGAPLLSQSDGRRHWEIFRGRARDGGAAWTWQAVTRDSRADNLRPIVPAGAASPSPVLWLRGTMRLPKDSALEVVTLASERP